MRNDAAHEQPLSGQVASISGDTIVVPAILDYLPHHSHVGPIYGDSYHPREKCRLRLLPKQRKEAAATASM